MKIGIDARFYYQSGVGRYLRNLIENLQKIDKKNEYIIFLLEDDYKTFESKDNFKKVVANFPWYGFSEQIKFPKLLNKYKLDLVHFPHFNVPIFYRGKFIVTIHDLIHQNFIMQRSTRLNPVFYKIKSFGYRKVFANAINKAEKVIVPSNYVLDLLIKKWGINREKVVVTYEGIDELMLKTIKEVQEKDSQKVIDKFSINPPYIFYVGNAHPHKNVEGLVKAFKELRKRYQYLQLVLSGYDHYFWQRLKSEYSQKDIIFTNQVTDNELVSLYKKSQAFILPSFDEGFGIPLLESMAAGTPVISSNKGSLSEIAGDASIYFDPYDLGDMVEKIDSVLKSENLRKDLIQKGHKRIKLFSFNKMAQTTLGVYNQCF